MIAFLTGQIHSKTMRGGVVILAHGVGYHVLLPSSDFSRINMSDTASLHIHTHVREDALELFGFIDHSSLALFEQLIAVNGIGPKLALVMLSSMRPEELISCVSQNDPAMLTRIPGIGNKTAQRIVLELKDRIAKLGPAILSAPSRESSIMADLRTAIANLGYKTQQVEKAVQSVKERATQGAKIEDLLREALRNL